jgi:hypothetical protein
MNRSLQRIIDRWTLEAKLLKERYPRAYHCQIDENLAGVLDFIRSRNGNVTRLDLLQELQHGLPVAKEKRVRPGQLRTQSEDAAGSQQDVEEGGNALPPDGTVREAEDNNTMLGPLIRYIVPLRVFRG